MIKKILFGLLGAISATAAASASIIKEGCAAINSLADIHAAIEAVHETSQHHHCHHFHHDDDSDDD